MSLLEFDLSAIAQTLDAVIRRNLANWFSSKVSFISTILWPIPPIAIAIYQYLSVGQASTIRDILLRDFSISSLSGMIIVGNLVYLVYNRLLWETGASLVEEKWMGTLEALLVTTSSLRTVILGNCLSSVIEAASWIAGVTMLTSLLFGMQLVVTDILGLAIAIVSSIIGLVALGIFFAGFFVASRIGDQLSVSLQAPIRFLSGVSFPVEALPQSVRLLAYLWPSTYAIIALRRSLLSGASMFQLFSDLWPIYVSSIILVVVGYWLIAFVEKRLKAGGALYDF